MASKPQRSTSAKKSVATRKPKAAAKPARMNKTDLIETNGSMPTGAPQAKKNNPKFKPGKLL